MSERPYPEGIDCVWLASDRDGHLGVFITAGIGPIPAEALKSACMPVEDIEGQICELPRVSEARLLVSVKRPDDFIDLAERGMFVYDWTDINRTLPEAIHLYEQVAVPSKPIRIDALPVNLAPLAKTLQFTDVVFAEERSVDVRAHLKCTTAE